MRFHIFPTELGLIRPSLGTSRLPDDGNAIIKTARSLLIDPDGYVDQRARIAVASGTCHCEIELQGFDIHSLAVVVMLHIV